MATFATGCLGQPGFVERRDLNQIDQLDPLHQQLGDAVASMHHDRRGGVQVDQRDLDFATISRVDGAGAIDDGKTYPRGQTGPRMDQPDHAEGNRDGNSRADQGAVPGRQLDVFGAEQIDPGVAFVRATG